MIREEHKLVLNTLQFEEFIRYVNQNMTKIYPSRNIFSVYYDTKVFQLYSNSINSETDKYKIRLRKYDNNKEIFFEKKFTFEEKYKISIPYKYNYFPETIFDNGINFFKKVNISYKREYFKLFSSRVTIDKNIKYFHPFYGNEYQENIKIIEFKLLNNDNSITQYIPFQTTKFSKYENAIKKVYNLY